VSTDSAPASDYPPLFAGDIRDIDPQHMLPGLPQIDAAVDPARGVDFLLRVFGPTTVIAIHAVSGAIRAIWLDASNKDRVSSWIAQHNQTGHNIYFHPNKPREGLKKKATKDDIEFIRASYGDQDCDKNNLTMVSGWAAITALPLKPTRIIASGGGFHPYYLRHEPLPATPETVERDEAVNTRIAALTRGDKVQNVDRIMRVPFTTNYPDATKLARGRTVCTSGVVVGEEGPRYTLEELEAAFSVGRVVTFPETAPTNTDPIKAPILGVPPALARQRTAMTTAAAAQPHRDDSRSGEVQRIAYRMRREGKTLEEFCEAVRTDPVTASWYTEKGILKNNRQLRRAWNNAGTPPALAQQHQLGAPFTELPHVMNGAVAVEHLNARLFKAADWNGAPCFGRFNADGTVDRLSIENIQVLLSGHFIEAPDGKGGDKRVAAASWWVQYPQKEVFDHVIYDPENKLARPNERVWNLYRGFAIEEAKGSWRRMRRHIWKYICRKDRKVFKYLIRWLAHLVQYPGTNPEVMVVLRSTKEGAGKSSLGKWMLMIFGPHGLEATEWEQVFGDFHDDLVNRSFVLLEEPMFPGDHQAAAVLRARLTAETISINPKGHKRYPIPHCIHYMMTTNAKWAIPAGNGARRFLMLDVDESVVGNIQYFIDLWNEANNGGVEAMLYALRRVNLDRFDIRDVPKTGALREQQLLSAPSTTRWAADAVNTGQLILPLGLTGGGSGFGQRIPGGALYAAYQAWCAGQRLRPTSNIEFGRWLGRTGLKSTPTHGRAHYGIPDAQQFAGAVLKEAGII
jgi:hypothetical protein